MALPRAPLRVRFLRSQTIEEGRRHEQLLFALVRQALPDGERTDSGAHWAEFRGVTLPE